MMKLSAAASAVGRWTLTAVVASFVAGSVPAKAEWDQPWKDESRALVIDAYEFNPINWAEMTSDERIAGFISKASDGLPPDWSCRGLSGDDERLCKNRWWKYSVTQELYFTRREMAKMLGLEWGAYHLGRPGNPREQADHFIDFTKPEPDELIALDIEDNDPEAWMSLEDAEIFADQIKVRLGRYPVLYTNGSTAEYISKNAEDYPLLSRLPLWYARYRDDITGRFPEETWPNYALWQFASMHNCNARSCPYRVRGAKTDIDVNVSPLTVAELKAAWPFNELVGDAPAPVIDERSDSLIAGLKENAGDAVAAIGAIVSGDEPANAASQGEASEARSMMLSAYAPSGSEHRARDPLELLTEAARAEHRDAERSPILSSLTMSAPRHDPDMPGDTLVPRAAPLRTHDVSAGMLDAIGQLEDRMESVRAIIRPKPAPGPAIGPLVEARPVTIIPAVAIDETAVARSRIAERLREAAEAHQLVPVGDRPVHPERRSTLEEGGLKGAWSRIGERVSAAFSATR